MIKRPQYKFLEGQTYSLVGDEGISADYYQLIAEFVNMCEEIIPQRRKLLQTLKKLHSRAWKYPRNKLELLVQKMIAPKLEKYTPNINAHLAQLPFYKIWDRNLRLSMRTYHLIMLEIELMNRINRNLFLESNGKIALLPYCLRDLSKSCNAAKSGLEYRCQSCSPNCFVNHASHIFLNFGVDAYLWMSSSLKGIFRLIKSDHEHFGVFGIACIPELYAGMQKCMKLGVPVLGVPLNANRCARWMGSFKENSVYLEQIEKLLTV